MDSPSSPLLPPEVLLRILHHLKPDSGDISNRAAIRQSRLIYKRLLSVCQLFRTELLPLLFESVTIEHGTPIRGQKSCISDQSFYHALNNGDVHAISVAKHIRRCMFFDHGGQAKYGPRYPHYPFKEIYTRAVQRMENITHVAFQNTLIDDNVLGLLLCLPRLTSLVIREGWIPRAGMQRSILPKLNITQFELSYDLYLEEKTLVECIVSPWKLNKLHINFGCDINLDNTAWSSALQDLTVNLLMADQVDSFGEMLNTSVPRLTCLRLTLIGLHHLPDDEHPYPRVTLDANSLPYLRILHCPPDWMQSFIPGRPIQEVRAVPAYELTLQDGVSVGMLSGIEKEPDALVVLQESAAKINYLQLGEQDYLNLISQESLRPNFSVDELGLVWRDVYVFMKKLLLDNSKLDLEWQKDAMRKRFAPLGDQSPSSTVRCLRLSGMADINDAIDRHPGKWNLSLQLRLVSLLSVAFPKATVIQVSTWVEWRLEVAESADASSQSSASSAPRAEPLESREWKPTLSVRGAHETYLSFLRCVQQEEFFGSVSWGLENYRDGDSDDPLAFVDYDGFFAGFCNPKDSILDLRA